MAELGLKIRRTGVPVFVALFFCLQLYGASCYQTLVQLQFDRLVAPEKPQINFAYASSVPISRAFEKEGLYYSDIADWYDKVDSKRASDRLITRLRLELSGEKPHTLLKWLKNYPRLYRQKGTAMKPLEWASLTPEGQLNFILGQANPFNVINIRGREALFYEELLKYDDLIATETTPEYLSVSDDLGSYEVKSNWPQQDRGRYLQQRSVVEEKLEGSVGHQHLMHGWPKDAKIRSEIAPYYIELLDAASWFLYWRQIRRSPFESESILFHPYLGIYTRVSLDRLHRAMVAGETFRFRNKFRMVGARNFRASKEKPAPGVQEDRLVDFELRSGNKGVKREFTEELIEARLVSGDYSGLRDFRNYDFDPSAPIEIIAEPFMDATSILTLQQFEQSFPYMRYSSHKLAHNHFRNKVLAPLLPWSKRIPLDHKSQALQRAQRRYADQLLKIAHEYLSKKDSVRGPPDLTELREEIIEQLEYANYLFARRMRLDRDFGQYLIPRFNEELPSPNITNSGPIDVNVIHIGIEFSFRFPDTIQSASQADLEIARTAEAFLEALGGGTLERLDDGGHGHDLSIRYRVTDANGHAWRIEWDGIRRSYEDGEATRPRRGHIEIPSPKKPIQDSEEIATLYHTLRSLGRYTWRGAGGAHLNGDLAPLFALPPMVGPRKLANLIALFESKRVMVQFLWQHPFRIRCAEPAKISEEFAEHLNKFEGTWDELGQFLYEERYFNPYISRKPAYLQFNATALMDSHIPEDYKKSIDIKNPHTEWFPSFLGKGKNKFEFRLFDAPSDEYMAVLQVKYAKALFNRAFNGPPTIDLTPQYPEAISFEWKKNPRLFIRDAQHHLQELGLDPIEFRPLLVESWEIQQSEPSLKNPLEAYKNFLPATP